MVCHAIGRCRICARKHTMPIFGSEENQHALIEIVKLRLIVLNTVCADCIEKFERVVKGKEASSGYIRSVCQPRDKASRLFVDDTIAKYDEIAVRPTMHFYVESDDNSARAASPRENDRLSPHDNFNCPERTVTHRAQREQDTNPLAKPSATGGAKNPDILKKVRAKSGVRCRLCCDYCEKEFTHKGDLKRHNRKHTGEKPYECTECSKKFSQLSNLSRHRLVHSGERPFACAQCGQGYSRKGRLINHIRRELCSRNGRRTCKLVGGMERIKEGDLQHAAS